VNAKWDSDTNSALLSDEEIELYLKGDRRDIDRLMLVSINKLTALIVPRIQFVDELREKERQHQAAIRKLGESTAFWALAIFLGFVGAAVWRYLVSFIKQG
jgi:hypothetical protein